LKSHAALESIFPAGYVTEEHRMPWNPKECREHARRCLKIAQEATNPALKASLEEIAQQWLRLLQIGGD
jgi:hypothetical protein